MVRWSMGGGEGSRLAELRPTRGTRPRADGARHWSALGAPAFGAAVLGAAVLGLALAACRAPSPGVPGAHSPPPSARSHALHAAVGEHGMVLFGRGAIYASHLPLYDPPHDTQVVIGVEVASPGADAMIREELARGGLVTFLPEPFDLARLSPSAAVPLRELTGAVYRGHFERGGQVIRAGVLLHVAAVHVHRPIDPAAPPAPPRWLAFGRGDETYLLHAVGSRPDIDLIVAVDGRLPEGEQLAEEGRDVGAPSPEWLARRGLRAARVIYREAEDLK